MDFDGVLEFVDDFGTYQRLLLALVLLPAFVPCGFHAYNQVFMAASPNHWCKIPDVGNLTQEQKLLLSIPSYIPEFEEDRIFRKCEMYALDIFDNPAVIVSDEEILEIISNNLKGNTSFQIKPCSYGWDYDFLTYSSTVVTEWDLVCDRSFYPTLALVLLGFSGLIGTAIFGYIQDSWGRRPAFFIYLSIQCIFGVGTAFAPEFWIWILCRIGVGFTVPAITGTPFVLAMEIVGPRKRTLCTILLNVAYSLCLMALAGVAYIFRDWRNFALATSLPFIIFFVYWWVLPESPRWLTAHGKIKEAEITLRKMARINGRILPKNFKQMIKDCYVNGEIKVASEENRRNYGVSDLFKGKYLRRNTILITFIWLINMGVYVGLSYYAPSLGGNEFWNFFIAGLAELPTYLFLFPSLDLLGRRWTLCGSMLIGGIACVSTILIKSYDWVTLSLYGIGKFGISAGFVAIQQMGAEIYPTVVRGLGISFSNVVGMIGPTLVPLVNYTGSEYMWLPLVVLGSLMVIGGIFGLFLPETLHEPLPQSLADAENKR